VQTFTTVGYGRLIPTATYSNLIASGELFAGMLVNAMLAGLAFARFSRPKARVLFSDVAVVTRQSGRQVFCVRLANERRSNIFAADVEATLVRLVQGPDGKLVRRYESLKLTRHHTPIFSLTFIAEHVLDETSPLHGINATSMQLEEAEIVITVSGLDNVTSQVVHASAAYGHDTILWHRRFADIVGYTNDGYRVIDYWRFHTTENCEHPPLAEAATASPA
jgi:inward rectifier potassium channel